ncbi:hypothetical protein EDB92DRAFT_2116998 [Lactarius akahatsu]|uniref:F-box domain-containing protein n=1 Tax=Lactarius akahatsu TaxID=416441 RepID=A0AAD4QA59_9AGAM|nr:hypothetical protein EDB92DRAFT_2116998 [Lactarius akahatsu]
MPFLKYLNTHARVRYVSPLQLVTTPSEFPASGRVTVEELSDNVLLKIFRYYLDVSPRHWPKLVHICHRWRRIVFASQQTLHLRMFCAHGRPVLKILRCYPTLPIAVQYGGCLELDPPAPEDEGNIVAALKQSNRVSSINLTVTSSLLEKLSSIKRPFSELEDLVLLSQDGFRLTLSSAFRWGPHLRCLHSTRIVIPALPQLLYSSRDLVDLQLHEGLYPRELSPEALANALSRMAQLRSLSLHFLSTTDYLAPPPQFRERFFLPALTRLNFRGISEYLKDLVARIDAPRLGDIEVTFFNEITIDAISILSKFIDRIEMHKSHRWAHIVSSERAISISLIQPGAPSCLKLQLLCGPLRDQLFSMPRICICFSALLSNVEDLRVSVTRPSGREESPNGGRWLRTINSFKGVKRFHLDSDHSTNIVRDLQLSDRRHESILPALHKLCIPQSGQHHAPLAKAVVSFMISRRLSGHHIAVEYEPLCHINELRGTEPLSQQVTIDMLSDDILLDIFRHCLDPTPQIWPMLSCVCQTWRRIVFASPLGLNLRLYCTYGTPVLKSLDCWPALPIIVQYGGVPNFDPPAPEDDDNIIAALKRSGRISSISLTATRSLLESLSTISEPFSELEDLVLLSRDNVQLTLSSTFRWGPRLRTLHSTRIAFPSLPQLLSHSHDLVDIQLHEVPSAGYFSPEVFVNALSGMTHLRTLSLHFLSLPPRRNFLSLPPSSGERVILPALTLLKYRGTSKYLDSLVARIDAPVLEDIDITLFSQPTMDASQLGRFVERIGIQVPLSQAEVQMSGHAISISFTSSGSSTPLRLQISCKQLDWQLSSMTQVCDQFSPFLSGVKNLRINSTQLSSGQNDVNGEQWLELIRAFGGATDLRVASELTTAILCALGLVEGGHATVLPSLRHLHIENPTAMNEPSCDGLLAFITSRFRSGHPVQVNVPFNQCHICHASFREKKEHNLHLIDQHGDRLLCSYCDNFECALGQSDLFRRHLRSEHFRVAGKDPHVWYYSLTPDQLGGLIARHGFVRAPDAVAPPTTVTAPHSQ